jgi:LacI family transcriptional regulator
MSRPTMADLAAAANVSISTVDRILNGRGPVRQSTAELVLQAAERIGFHGTAAIQHRLTNGKPVRKLGFLLQYQHHQEYRLWGESLAEATRTCGMVHGRPIVRYLEDISPESIIDSLLQLSREVDALALVAPDQPTINQVVDALATEGVPVFSVISDLTCPLDDRDMSASTIKKEAVQRPGSSCTWAENPAK